VHARRPGAEKLADRTKKQLVLRATRRTTTTTSNDTRAAASENCGQFRCRSPNCTKLAASADIET
jgi:hypothetical protein